MMCPTHKSSPCPPDCKDHMSKSRQAAALLKSFMKKDEEEIDKAEQVPWPGPSVGAPSTGAFGTDPAKGPNQQIGGHANKLTDPPGYQAPKGWPAGTSSFAAPAQHHVGVFGGGSGAGGTTPPGQFKQVANQIAQGGPSTQGLANQHTAGFPKPAAPAAPATPQLPRMAAFKSLEEYAINKALTSRSMHIPRPLNNYDPFGVQRSATEVPYTPANHAEQHSATGRNQPVYKSCGMHGYSYDVTKGCHPCNVMKSQHCKNCGNQMYKSYGVLACQRCAPSHW